jgi:hypothetical protein
MIKTRIATIVLCSSLFLAGVAVAQRINPARHPNLAAAQTLCEQAFEKLAAAQKANEYDMGGHAAKARELLEQVNQQIKMAAAAANAK